MKYKLMQPLLAFGILLPSNCFLFFRISKCILCFCHSMLVIFCCDKIPQPNQLKEEVILAYGSRGREFLWWRRHGNSSRKLTKFLCIERKKTKTKNRKYWQGYKPSKPISVKYFPSKAPSPTP